jgi:hypothetical protein
MIIDSDKLLLVCGEFSSRSLEISAVIQVWVIPISMLTEASYATRSVGPTFKVKRTA